MVRLLGARWAVELLLDEISRPGEIAPGFLKQLENPERQGYSYIRLLPPRESENQRR